MKRWSFSAVALLITVVVIASQDALAQFADRAIITGVVTDASGAAVPDARVTITDEQVGAMKGYVDRLVRLVNSQLRTARCSSEPVRQRRKRYLLHLSRMVVFRC